MNWHDTVFLAGAGFVLGVLAYTGWYTTHRHPDERAAYAVIGLGALICVVTSTYLAYRYDASNWFLIAQVIGYGVIGCGLTLLVATRRRRR